LFILLEEKSFNPKSVCNATKSELVTEGGEFKFICKMIEDSLILKEKITWYTSLVGR
jgi:23S rRNA (adenine1618-N6)-methyltransferase